MFFLFISVYMVYDRVRSSVGGGTFIRILPAKTGANSSSIVRQVISLADEFSLELYNFRALATFACLVRTKFWFQKTKDTVKAFCILGRPFSFCKYLANLWVARLVMTYKRGKTQKTFEMYPFRAITTFAFSVRTKIFFQKTKEKVKGFLVLLRWFAVTNI
jgi:hypothetical protein